MCWCLFISCALSHHSQTQPKNEKCWKRTEWYIIIDWVFFAGDANHSWLKSFSSKKHHVLSREEPHRKQKQCFFDLKGKSPYKQGKKSPNLNSKSASIFPYFFYEVQPNKGVYGPKSLRKLVQISNFFCAENVPKNAPVRQSNFIPNYLFPPHKIHITCQFVLKLKTSHKLVSKPQVFSDQKWFPKNSKENVSKKFGSSDSSKGTFHFAGPIWNLTQTTWVNLWCVNFPMYFSAPPFPQGCPCLFCEHLCLEEVESWIWPHNIVDAPLCIPSQHSFVTLCIPLCIPL